MEITTRELKIMLDQQEKRSDEKHADILIILNEVKSTGNMTLTQAQKTNGRVSRHDLYFKIMWWALGAIWTLIIIGIPLLYNLFMFGLNVKISDAVEKSLKDNVASIDYEK